MAKSENHKKAQLDELYCEYQVYLAHLHCEIQLNPSAFEHLDRKEKEKCWRLSGILRHYHRLYDGDPRLIRDALGSHRPDPNPRFSDYDRADRIFSTGDLPVLCEV